MSTFLLQTEQIISCLIFTGRTKPVPAEKSRTALLTPMGNSKLKLPILTSPPGSAPSDSAVSINHISLPKMKIFQIFKRMWQGFERISKRVPKHSERRQLAEKLCYQVTAGQATTLVQGFGCHRLHESQCFM